MSLPIPLTLALTGIILFLAGLACGLLFNLAKKPKKNSLPQDQPHVKSNLITYPVSDSDVLTARHFLNRHDQNFPTNDSTAVVQLVVLSENGRPLAKTYPLIDGGSYGRSDQCKIETENHGIKWDKALGLISVDRNDGKPNNIELGVVVGTYI